MNNQRLLNMAMRMMMRIGMRWMRDRNRAQPTADQDEPQGQDRRAYRGKQPQGDAAKRLRSMRRLKRF